MARAATTSDAFNAIAEPHRRAILTLLRGNERPVGDVALSLGLNQPAVSKHLKVLREVGLVYARRAGKQRLYGLDARGSSRSMRGPGASRRFGTRPSIASTIT